MAKVIIVLAKTVMKRVEVEDDQELTRKDLEEIVRDNFPDYEIVEIIKLPLDK